MRFTVYLKLKEADKFILRKVCWKMSENEAKARGKKKVCSESICIDVSVGRGWLVGFFWVFVCLFRSLFCVAFVCLIVLNENKMNLPEKQIGKN